MTSSPTAPVVTLENVSLWRGKTMILDGISWRVEAGQHWAVIGPNGCGKTTLLKIVSGWLFPSRGEVMVLGQTFGGCDMAELRRGIGWVSNALEQMIPPQLMTLGVVLTGKNAALGIREEPTAADLEQAMAQLAVVGCAQRAELPFSLLSTGEQIRVMIARALMSAPRLLILDEPCNGLDPVARDAFLASVESLVRRQRELTILFVTHHLEEIIPAIHHVLALRGGRVEEAGPKISVLTEPVLERVFGTPFRVRRDAGRYQAHPRVPEDSIWRKAPG